MSNPADKAATQENQENKSDFAAKVADAIKAATKDAKGNLVLPEGLPEEVHFAATSEKRRLDTVASMTRDKQKINALEAEKAKLLDNVVGTVNLNLTEAQAEELEQLKFEDPEAWRGKMNELETAAKKKRRTEIDEELKQVSSTTLVKDELTRRKDVLKEFLEEHEGFHIDDDVIDNDIPPRIKRKLDKGEVTFEEFLQECYEYTTTGKVIKQEKTNDGPNLSKVAGGKNPSDTSVKEDIIKSYKKETY